LKVAVIGAGLVGARVIQQLRKNRKIEVITIDPRDYPPALGNGNMDKTSYKISLTPSEIGNVLRDEKPDIVLVTTSNEALAMTSAPWLNVYVESLAVELGSQLEAPVITVSREMSV